MKRHDGKTPAREIPQGVRRGELLPLAGLLARLGVGRKTVWQLERSGLRGLTVCGRRYFLGDDVLDFFGRLAQQQAHGNGEPAMAGKP